MVRRPGDPENTDIADVEGSVTCKEVPGKYA